MPNLFPARVLQNQPDAESQVLLTVQVPRDVWSMHHQPAQYVDLSLPGMAPWRGTISNRPGRELFEFLIKDVGERSHCVATLAPGDEIQTTPPAGEGFPVSEYRRMDLVLAANGVAIGSIRSVVEEILLRRPDFGVVDVFYGERNADRFAFTEERERWRENGISVHLSASRPSGGTYFRGHVGYVQDLMHEILTDTRNAIAFLVGAGDMVKEASTVLVRLGLPENRIHSHIHY